MLLQEITILPEIQERLCPLAPAEFETLRARIKEDGLREPLVIWPRDGQTVLVDGHNRLRIAQELGLAIQTVEKRFDDLAAALWWVDDNQIGRRWMTEDYRAEVLGRHYNERKLSHGGDRKSEDQKENFSFCSGSNATARAIAQKARVDEKTVRNYAAYASAVEKMKAANPEAVQRIRNGEIRDAKTRLAAIPDADIPQVAEKLAAGVSTIVEAVAAVRRDNLQAEPIKPPDGTYDVIVVDPPWPMQRIEREAFPMQAGLDYPTMALEEIEAMEIPASADCHLFLWTTQKFLPAAFQILEGWGFRYVSAMVWHKPGGFQPFGLMQYNCEFALYARKGNPKFVDTKAFPACFNAPRGAHSEKPAEFYEMISRVTSGRRIEIFSRRKIEGFDAWGDEADASVAAVPSLARRAEIVYVSNLMEGTTP